MRGRVGWILAFLVLLALAAAWWTLRSGGPGGAGKEQAGGARRVPRQTSAKPATEPRPRGPALPAPSATSAAAPVNRTAPADTARGTIAVVGAIPYPSVVLEPSAGRFPLTLTGEHVASLEQLSGLEVWVAGTLDPDRRELRATAFAVRAANGVPAVDGRLALAGDSLVLVTTDGARRRIRHPPAALRELVGAHVWIAGQPDAEPLAFGLIRRSP